MLIIIIKPKLFVDFDNTICNTTEAFCSVYSSIYQHHPKFIFPKWELVDQYNFLDQCPLTESVEEVFKMEALFKSLKFINDNTYEILGQLNEKYQIVIASIGTYDNISLKSQYVKDNLPFIKDSVFLVNQGCAMNKNLINMSGEGNVFIDDVVSNLNSVQVERKIAFGTIHQWNKDWNGERALDWTEVKRLLL